ncbi:E2F_TDP domain-containing protein [Cephalotus follicularis]|uniref:E2F_TDP domain-containing protein n=1 Tax=Cephalotus follicularis TaxID=3775 RepID=A0A1Q3CL92_CEPFO|nr:E2F_TDP domain-containing protein [Cephalotus follicularis]
MFVYIENKRKKSLSLLTQNFAKLFLCSSVDMITLDNAAMALLGETHNSGALRAKIRRLYDFANVFSSINLIEKTHQPESRKPAFRWLGWQGKPENESTTSLDQKESKKRLFEADITNYSLKRNQEDCAVDCIVNRPMHKRHKDLENDCNGNKSGEHLKQGPKGFVFGPFAPVSVTRIDDSENKNVKKFQDFESLASTYRPQCHN